MMLIVYGLADPRTGRIRYIGKSERGAIRALEHRFYAHNGALAAWLRDLRECQKEYVVLTLAEATTPEQLAALEGHWVALGISFGWPLTNKARPQGRLTVAPGRQAWSAQAWRRDPEVQARLAAARPSRRTVGKKP